MRIITTLIDTNFKETFATYLVYVLRPKGGFHGRKPVGSGAPGGLRGPTWRLRRRGRVCRPVGFFLKAQAQTSHVRILILFLVPLENVKYKIFLIGKQIWVQCLIEKDFWKKYKQKIKNKLHKITTITQKIKPPTPNLLQHRINVLNYRPFVMNFGGKFE